MRGRTERGRRGALAVAAAAAGLLTACAPATAPVQVAAATAALRVTPWTDPAPPATTVYPDLPVGEVPWGMQVPQPPRPVHVGRNVPPAAHGVSPTYTPPTASCGGYSNPAPHRAGRDRSSSGDGDGRLDGGRPRRRAGLPDLRGENVRQ